MDIIVKRIRTVYPTVIGGRETIFTLISKRKSTSFHHENTKAKNSFFGILKPKESKILFRPQVFLYPSNIAGAYKKSISHITVRLSALQQLDNKSIRNKLLKVLAYIFAGVGTFYVTNGSLQAAVPTSISQRNFIADIVEKAGPAVVFIEIKGR